MDGHDGMRIASRTGLTLKAGAEAFACHHDGVQQCFVRAGRVIERKLLHPELTILGTVGLIPLRGDRFDQ